MTRAARYSTAAATTVAILAAGAWGLAPRPTQLRVTARAGDDTIVINPDAFRPGVRVGG